MYRPEGWEYQKATHGDYDNATDGEKWDIAHSHGWRDGYEAGADAMLKRLLSSDRLDTPSFDMRILPEYKVELYGRVIDSKPWMLCDSMTNIKTKGRLVFIPEEVKPDEVKE